MADLQVTCIAKQPRDDPHEGISRLGGAGWSKTRAEVIELIRAGTNTYYTNVNGRRSSVGVVDGARGPYLRTHADGYWNNDLLALPECS